MGISAEEHMKEIVQYMGRARQGLLEAARQVPEHQWKQAPQAGLLETVAPAARLCEMARRENQDPDPTESRPCRRKRTHACEAGGGAQADTRMDGKKPITRPFRFLDAPSLIFGPLNAYEWLEVTAHHENRHKQQIQEIATDLRR
jgi:hypothetical protein